MSSLIFPPALPSAGRGPVAAVMRKMGARINARREVRFSIVKSPFSMEVSGRGHVTLSRRSAVRPQDHGLTNCRGACGPLKGLAVFGRGADVVLEVFLHRRQGHGI